MVLGQTVPVKEGRAAPQEHLQVVRSCVCNGSARFTWLALSMSGLEDPVKLEEPGEAVNRNERSRTSG
jgi:hypothetical protein